VQYDSVLILAHSFILQIQSNSRSSCAVSPACSRIEDSVFGLIITLACLGTVTLPGLVGCFKVTWLPLCRTGCQPACFKARRSSTAVIRGDLGLICSPQFKREAGSLLIKGKYTNTKIYEAV